MANQPNLIPSAWAANNSTTETIPATTTESGKASWDQGFPVETSLPLSEGGIPPKYGDFNGVLNVLSQFCLFAQSGGQFAWVNSLDYSVGSIVLGTDGSIYRAAQVSGPSTTAVNPVGDTSGKWERIVSKSDINALEQEISDAMDAAEDAVSNASAAQSAVTTLDANVVKLSGNQTVGGKKTFTSPIVITTTAGNATEAISASTSTGAIHINGGAGEGNGAFISLCGKDLTVDAGTFYICAKDGVNTQKNLKGQADGTLTWDGKDIITNGGNQTVGGVKTFTSNIGTTAYPAMYNPDEGDDNVLQIIAGHTTSGAAGAKLSLAGANVNGTNQGGDFTLQAGKSGASCQFIGKPDGTLTWGGNNVITAAGGTMTGDLYRNGGLAKSNTTSGQIDIMNGTQASDGGGIWMYGKDHSSRKGMVNLQGYHDATIGYCSLAVKPDVKKVSTNCDIVPGVTNTNTLGDGNTRWKQLYANTATINTSDERQKTAISAIPDAVLDAWGDAQWQQFQMRDAVAEKGDKARIHNGLIAQRIDEVFKAHGLDISRYGLFCHDSWDAQEEIKDDDGIVQNACDAGDMYSIRYEEALCMEAAYQRRRADRAETRISALEQRLGELEAVLASLISPVNEEQIADAQEGEGADA